MKISVIIPVFNSEKYLHRCLCSITKQNFNDLEIILVNDGSTDESEDICKTWEQKDKRIKYIKKQNGGPSSARNEGLKYATGEYVHFMDSDDWIDVNTYSRCYDLICQFNQPDIIKFNFVLTNGQTKREKIERRVKKISRKEIFEYFFRIHGERSNYSVWDKLINKNILNNFKFVDTMFEDVEGSYDLYYRSNSIVETNEEMYFYFKNDKSITNSVVCEKDLDYLNVWKRIVDRTKIEIPDFYDYALFCEKRARFTLLAKMLIKGYSRDNKKVCDIKPVLKSCIRKNFWELFFSKMPFNRKILLLLLVI